MSLPPPQTDSSAQIFDQGYRRYDGPRTGVSGAIRSLVRHSFRHALGFGRAARYKVLPFAVILMAYAPAIVFVGIGVLLPPEIAEGALPGYAQYYGFVIATIYLLAGFTVPELLCSDRRTGLLGVYLASPLSRNTYLAGKFGAVLLLMSLVTFGPPFLLLVSLSLQELGPNGFEAWIKTFVFTLLAAIVMALTYASIAFVVASVTDRTAVATATYLAAIPGTSTVSAIMTDGIGLSPHFRLFDLIQLPRNLVFRIFGENDGWLVSQNPTWTLWAVWMILVGGSLAATVLRYQRLLVRR